MRAMFERFYPVVGSAIISLGYFQLHDRFDFISRDALGNLFTAIVSVSAIAVGFLATAQSILFSLDNKRVTHFPEGRRGLPLVGRLHYGRDPCFIRPRCPEFVCFTSRPKNPSLVACLRFRNLVILPLLRLTGLLPRGHHICTNPTISRLAPSVLTR
jgi:hypothetical protein